jgi:hypothetical protein
MTNRPPSRPDFIRFSVAPRLVPAQKAARRLHLTPKEFEEKMRALRRAGFPAACSVTGHYDLRAIDEWLDRRVGLGGSGNAPASPEAPMQRLGGWKTETAHGAAKKAAQYIPPQFEKYREQLTGYKFYKPGEWEALVKRQPLQHREKLALADYYRTKNGIPLTAKGAGHETLKRLLVRGYVVSVDPNPKAPMPICKITPEGEAAWLTMSGKKDDLAKE